MNNKQKTKHKKSVHPKRSLFGNAAQQKVVLSVLLYATILQTHNILWPLETTPHDCLLILGAIRPTPADLRVWRNSLLHPDRQSALRFWHFYAAWFTTTATTTAASRIYSVQIYSPHFEWGELWAEHVQFSNILFNLSETCDVDSCAWSCFVSHFRHRVKKKPSI